MCRFLNVAVTDGRSVSALRYVSDPKVEPISLCFASDRKDECMDLGVLSTGVQAFNPSPGFRAALIDTSLTWSRKEEGNSVMKQPGKKSRETTTRVSASTETPPRDLDLPKQKEGLSPEQVARRAYELYCERGQQEGHDIEDWLRAENELSISHG